MPRRSRPPPSPAPAVVDAAWHPHRLPGPPLVASFVARPNRFLARVALPGGPVVDAHVPDRGRLPGLLGPGSPVLVFPADVATRRTQWSLLAAKDVAADTWVATDPAHANVLAERLLESRTAPFSLFSGSNPNDALHLRREVTVGSSRVDFLLEPDDPALGPMLVEVKSVGLVDGRRALFPDAPTARGSKHLATLEAWVKDGRGRAGVLFVIQRGDADVLSPNAVVDPGFATALRRVARRVELAAAVFEVSPEGLRFVRFVPVEPG